MEANGAAHEGSLPHRARLLDEWVARERAIAMLHAEQAELLTERLDLMAAAPDFESGGDVSLRSLAAEYAAAGHIPPSTAAARLTDAWRPVHQYPQTLAGLRGGRISRRHADVLLAHAIKDRLTAQATQVVKARPAHKPQPTPPITPDDLEPDVVPEELPPEPAGDDPTATDQPAADEPVFLEDLSEFSAAARAHDLLAEPDDDPPPSPSAWMQPPPQLRDDDVPDLDAELEVLLREFADATPVDPLPPGEERAHMLTRYLPSSQIGADDDDTRTMDQIRADVLADILLTADPAASTGSGLESVRATVQVTIAATTLAGADDRPAQLDGVGPIEPEWARELAGLTPSLDRLFLDHRGMVTATDSYTPTANMKRFLRARDQHCRFPGCRAPVHRCQGDHNHDHAKGGRTELKNLALLCTGHHPLKHPHLPDKDRWRARQLADGVVEWTRPLGRTYTDAPLARVMFV